MIAVNVGSGSLIEVFPSDEYIKRAVPNSSYWGSIDDKSIVLIKADDVIEDIRHGHEYYHYLIDSELFDSMWTNSHDELKKIYKSNKVQQLSLF